MKSIFPFFYFFFFLLSLNRNIWTSVAAAWRCFNKGMLLIRFSCLHIMFAFFSSSFILSIQISRLLCEPLACTHTTKTTKCIQRKIETKMLYTTIYNIQIGFHFILLLFASFPSLLFDRKKKDQILLSARAESNVGNKLQHIFNSIHIVHPTHYPARCAHAQFMREEIVIFNEIEFCAQSIRISCLAKRRKKRESQCSLMRPMI